MGPDVAMEERALLVFHTLCLCVFVCVCVCAYVCVAVGMSGFNADVWRWCDMTDMSAHRLTLATEAVGMSGFYPFIASGLDWRLLQCCRRGSVTCRQNATVAARWLEAEEWLNLLCVGNQSWSQWLSCDKEIFLQTPGRSFLYLTAFWTNSLLIF